MKKTTLFLTCCIGMMLLASCSKDVKPSISVATGSNYAGQNTELFSGDQITVGFSVTGENLTKIEMNVSQNGTVLYTDTQSIDNAASYLYTHNFSIDAIGTVTISGTVTDAKDNTATTSFDIICYEKPNAKFVGHYEGDILITGIYDINITNMDPMHEDFTDEPFAAIVDIVAGDNMDEVMATVSINGQENTVKGTVESNKVSFEAINDTYTMHYDYNGMDIPIALDMTYNITGTLNDGQLDLEGNCKGSGNINLFIINGTIEMEGTVGGSLTKTE